MKSYTIWRLRAQYRIHTHKMRQDYALAVLRCMTHYVQTHTKQQLPREAQYRRNFNFLNTLEKSVSSEFEGKHHRGIMFAMCVGVM